MDYYEQIQFETLERQYLEPPDEDETDDEYDRRWDELSDMRYEEMKENEVLKQ